MTCPGETPRSMRRARRRRRRQLSQAGITLVEVLVALSITALLVGPVSAWAVGTLRFQGTGRDELGRATATGLLNTYFVRDIASARLVQTSAGGALGTCTGVPAGGGTEQVLLRVTRAGTGRGSVVYSEVRRGDDSSLIRRVCAADGSLADSTVVFDRIEPGSLRAGCPEPSDSLCDTERKVSLELRPAVRDDGTPRRPVVISTVRRTDAESVGLGSGSPPDARVRADPSRGYRDTVFTLTSESSDPDDDLAGQTWTLPPGVELVGGGLDGPSIQVRFPGGQSNPIRLTATDRTGAAAATEVPIEILDRSPIVQASCAADEGAPRRMLLSGAGSVDPDGGVLSFEWRTPDGSVLTGSPAVWDPPDSVAGRQLLTLVAVNGSGRASTAFAECLVGGGAGVLAGVSISPEPIASAKGAPHLNVPFDGVIEVTFRADPPVPDPAGYQVALYRAGAAAPTSTSPPNTTTLTVPFGGGDSGAWEVALVRDGTAGQRRAFRINASPRVESLRTIFEAGRVPTRRVAFSATDSDLDGSVVTRIWDFGDGGDPLVNPVSSPEHTYTAPGSYVVRLTVVDDDGASSDLTLTVVVPEP